MPNKRKFAITLKSRKRKLLNTQLKPVIRYLFSFRIQLDIADSLDSVSVASCSDVVTTMPVSILKKPSQLSTPVVVTTGTETHIDIDTLQDNLALQAESTIARDIQSTEPPQLVIHN